MQNRLKIEEIFTHPWVLGFEAEQEKKNKKLAEEKNQLFSASAGVGGFYKKMSQNIDTRKIVQSSEKTGSSKMLELKEKIEANDTNIFTGFSPKKSQLDVKRTEKFFADFLDLSNILIIIFIKMTKKIKMLSKIEMLMEVI